MKVRHYVGAAACVGIIVGFGGPAFAGEWSPGKGPTPIKTEGVANSICAFNGRDEPDNGIDDFDDEQWAMTPAGGNVQSGGQFVAMTGSSGPGAVADVVQSGFFRGFGDDCRPSGD